MINPHSSPSTDESLLPANSSGVGRGTAAKPQGPTFKKQQPDVQSCLSTAAELGRQLGQLGQPRHSPPGTAMGRGLGVFGALSSSSFAAAPSPSLLAGVLLCTHRHPWVLHEGGDCATTHPVLVSLPAPEVSTLLPHSFIQSFSSAFAAEFPLSHRGNTAALGTPMHVRSPREVRACRTLGPGNAGRGHRQGW